ncbi:MAG: hypothetical protein KIT56_04530 [Gammaproteobacteria bacterium]|nr:hypothetical protein [Gammaproteobacteria bacterium]MCW5583144.1 hypothetical protein [Gammaproteobacteria bacterium]
MFRYTMFPKIFTKNMRQMLPEETYELIEAEQHEEEKELLISQLEFLNGNYPSLLKKESHDAVSVNTQLNVYLNRFLTSNAPWFALGGNNEQVYAANLPMGHKAYPVRLINGCTPLPPLKEKTRFHRGLVIDTYNGDSRVAHEAICIMYFVDTIDELRDIHAESLGRFEEVNKLRHHDYPFPPVILIVQNESSDLLNRENLVDCTVPVLDTWYVPSVEVNQGYYSKNYCDYVISPTTWEEFLHRLTPLFFQLAVTRGMVNREILHNQIAFLKCANQLNWCPKEVWSLIGDYLFQYNFNASLMKQAPKKSEQASHDTSHENERRCSLM